MNKKKDTDDKALELALAAIESQYGKGTISSGDYVQKDVEVIPTGNFLLDEALGVGGLPTGRVVEIYGGEGLGKSLLALSLSAQAQKAGHKVLYVDAEHDLDPTWAEFIGVNMEDLLICQPDYGEQGLDVAHKIIKSGAVKLVVIDSVAALVPQAELEGELTDSQVALIPRMLSKSLRKMRADINSTKTCVVFLNQIRDKIGFMQSGTQSPGGHALKFFSSVRIELKGVGAARAGEEVIGQKVQAKTIKNKVASPHKVINYNVLDGIGFDNYSPVLERSVKLGLLIRKGSWLYLPAIDPETGELQIDEKTGEIGKGSALGNGMVQIRSYLNEHPEIYDQLLNDIKEKDNG